MAAVPTPTGMSHTRHRLLSENQAKGQPSPAAVPHRRAGPGRICPGDEKRPSACCNSIPSIAARVIFNEGWGQFETARITDLARREDPTRLIDAASGWFDQGCGDFQSLHNYFFPMRIEPEEKRATVLSEYGGYSLIVPGHTTSEDLYGYGTYQDTASPEGSF